MVIIKSKQTALWVSFYKWKKNGEMSKYSFVYRAYFLNLTRTIDEKYFARRKPTNFRGAFRTHLNTYVVAHSVKSVQIRSFFWSVFSCIQSKYGKIRARKKSRSSFFEKIVKDFWKKMFVVDFAVIHKIFETIFSFHVK